MIIEHSLCTCCTTSSLIGAVKTAGRGNEPEDSPAAEKTETVGREAAIVDIDLDDLEETWVSKIAASDKCHAQMIVDIVFVATPSAVVPCSKRTEQENVA